MHDILLPAKVAFRARVAGNIVKQLLQPERVERVTIERDQTRRSRTWRIKRPDGPVTLITARRLTNYSADEVLLVPRSSLPEDVTSLQSFPSRARWIIPEPSEPEGDAAVAEAEERCERVHASWRRQFYFIEEERSDGDIITPGLRPPQIGALHAVLAHWKVTDAPATIVMPTGTGKTETMLAVLVHERLPRLLVVVPTATLRNQLANKFLALGVLRSFGVIGSEALYPVVGTLEHRFRTPEEAETYFRCCNVVVTTMNVVSGMSEEVRRKIAEMSSHLFIDEAHHIRAPSWEDFRSHFLKKPILQFTATPFRNDGRHVDGKIIFNYPLRKAQEEGYFKPITFHSIRDYRPEEGDVKIARLAVAQLENDIAAGFEHIVMARAATVKRATELYALYQEIAPEHAPILLHSRLGVRQRRRALERLRSRESRVVVCVDMLGEGFDLPELKIAALHDVHKSLAITLQFVGRFTRARPDLGDATAIANIADTKVQDSLRELYSEDPDWNQLLRQLSEGATTRQVERAEFLEGFVDVPEEIPLQNIFPKMSTVVYRTRCARWSPERVRRVFPDQRILGKPTLNPGERVLVFVTREREPVSWGDVRGLENTTWDLYLLHWNEEQGLLYINSSNNDSLHEELAKAVAGADVDRIRGDQVFRSLSGINRLMLMNLGLNHSLSRAVRFTMYTGGDIGTGLTEAQLQNKIKSNLFGRGFENGGKASIGCSHRGRIWSYKIADDISAWVEWCQAIGRKLLDNSIDTAEILQHVLRPQETRERPPLVPLVIEWSEAFVHREGIMDVEIRGERVPFYEASLELVSHDRESPLRFRVSTGENSAIYEISFRENGVDYVPVGLEEAVLVVNRKRLSLSEAFQNEPPILRFENGAFLIYDRLYTPRLGDRAPFDRERIEAWDWSGTNLKKESQTLSKDTDSVQYGVIQELLRPDRNLEYDIVFDDDAAHEAADVVAIKVNDDRLIVHLFHCKYSKESEPGARVDDLYAVCGQAQRSVFWKGDVTGLFEHLRRRELKRLEQHDVSRFERGNLDRLAEIERQAPYLDPEFTIYVVQPGLSKARAGVDQLELLAVTELYLQETYAIDLGVIASP